MTFHFDASLPASRAFLEPLREILRRPVEVRGHAIECRINAEHPETFAPSPGRITGLNLPGGVGVRVDTAVYTDAVISPHYDSLVAKLIAYGANRDEAISRMNRALEMFVVEGIHTTIPLHQRILAEPDFLAGKLSTHFLERFARVPSAGAARCPEVSRARLTWWWRARTPVAS